MKLINRQEIIGFLKEIKKGNGVIKLFFLEMQNEVEIPLDCEEKIKKYIGNKIGIFLLDNTFYFREIEGDENEDENK